MLLEFFFNTVYAKSHIQVLQEFMSRTYIYKSQCLFACYYECMYIRVYVICAQESDGSLSFLNN